MNKLLIIFLSITFLSCQSQLKEKFVEITPYNGCMDLMLESGSLGSTGSVQTYFIGMFKSPVEPKHGFIVMKLRRGAVDTNNIAYRLLDSMYTCEKATEIDFDLFNFQSKEERQYWQTMRDIEMRVRCRFYDHVKIYIEPEAIKTSISERAFLIYQ